MREKIPTAQLGVRVSRERYTMIVAAAEADGVTTATWVRHACEDAGRPAMLGGR